MDPQPKPDYFHLGIWTSNAAFDDDAAGMIAKLLDEVATRIRQYGPPSGGGCPIVDPNGNQVGSYHYDNGGVLDDED